MADKDDYSQEEYQFPEDEVTPAPSQETYASRSGGESSSSSPQEEMAAAMQNPGMRLASLLFIIITIFIIYHFMGRSKPTTPASIAPTANQAADKPVSVARRSVPSPARAEEVVALRRQMVELRQLHMNERSQVHQLEIGMQHVEDMLSELDDAMTDVNKKVHALTRHVANQAAQKKAKSRAEKTKRSAPAKPPLVYTLESVVRGRAWVRSSEGRAFSVKLGDTLPVYGRVLGIDPVRGVVRTEKGRNFIVYGRDDA